MHQWGFFFPQKINELKFLKWNEVIEDKHGSSCCHCCPVCPARPAPFGVAGVSLHFLSVSPSCFSLNNLIKRRGSQSDHLLIGSDQRWTRWVAEQHPVSMLQRILEHGRHRHPTWCRANGNQTQFINSVNSIRRFRPTPIETAWKSWIKIPQNERQLIEATINQADDAITRFGCHGIDCYRLGSDEPR